MKLRKRKGIDMDHAKNLREQVFEYVRETYGTQPEYLWPRFPDCAVLRRGDSRKWYGIVMDVPREKLGLPGLGRVDILNVKLGDPLLTELLLGQPGYRKSYHMGGNGWISILLDGTVPVQDICHWLDHSYGETAPPMRKKRG